LLVSVFTLSACLGGADTEDINQIPGVLNVGIEGGNSVVEGSAGASLRFTIILSETSDADVTVEYRTRSGSATSDADFVSNAGSVSLPAGSLRADIDIAVLNDNLDEPEESFFVELTSTSAGTIAVSNASGSIVDDDEPPVISIADRSITEGNNGQVNLIFTVSLSAASAFDVSVDYATANGSAAAGSDYTAATGTLTFPAGSTARTITVPVLGDNTVENDETFTVTLSNPQDGTLGTATATGTIIDDDVVVVLPQLSIGNRSVTEGNNGTTTMTFTISANTTPASDVTVEYATTDGTATAGVDYTATSGTATIVAGSNSTTVDVLIIADTVDEANETLTVTLNNAVNATVVGDFAIGTIVDDDNPAAVPQITISDSAIDEGDSGQSNLSFTLSLNMVAATDVTVNYATSDNTATAGSDYVAASGVATITAGNTSTAITVAVIGDTVAENNETLTVTLSNPANASLADTTATGRIDDDDPLPGITIADATVTEGDSGTTNMAFIITLDALSSVDVSVAYATRGLTATSDVDYTSDSGVITIAAGNTTATLNVSILGDNDVEDDEDFRIDLTNAVNATINDAGATGSIVDDDNPLPRVSIADASVTEGDSGTVNMVFTISIDAVSADAVMIDYATSDGTAAAGSDYTSTSGTATIAAGVNSTQISVPVNGDTDVENNENFTVSLSNPVNVTVQDGSATGTINDDDDPLPTVSIADASLTEGDSGTANMAFTISLSAASADDVTVAYATSNGTATDGSDYTATSGTATITAGNTSTVVNVPVIGDSDVEPDETFSVSLSNATNATISNGGATGTIIDDDNPLPRISIADSSVTEGDSGTVNMVFTISLDAAGADDVTVAYATSDDTAAAGSDYTSTNGTATITAGATSTQINVPVIGDTSVENNEEFAVTLSNPTNATLLDGSAVGTINDDDVALPGLSIADGSVTEGDTGTVNLAFTISIAAASADDVTVAYATSNGTATAGSDYTSTSGTATITAGNTSTVVNVPVIGDTDVESDEDFTVTLSSPTNATIQDGSATGTITNDDVAVVPQISIADTSVNEGNSGTVNMVFTVSLDVAGADDVTVSFATTNGTATAGSDYVSTSGTATITAGNTSTSINVPVNGDTDVENDEDFRVDLSSPTNATIQDGGATGTIVNDDVALPQISVGDRSLTEGDSGSQNMTFTISLDTPAGSTVTVAYATSDGTATAGSDYTATSGTATITSGNSSTTVNVPILGDTTEESNETFTLGLSSPVNATISDGSATGTINDDDTVATSGLDSRPQNLSCVAPAEPTVDASITTETAFGNLPTFNKPVGLLQAPGDTSQWYVVEQTGRVFRFDNNASVSTRTTFIDIQDPGDPIDVDSGSSETGMLGMAFHPDYGTSNWDVYLSYTIDGVVGSSPYRSVIARFESTDNGATLDPNSAEVLLTLDQTASNHNGGHIGFGPDGYLYILFGDGGPGNDPNNNAQNTNNLFGSMLRINVDSGSPYSIPGDNMFAGNALCSDGDGADDCPEIYAYGFRNSWRWSFDPPTGQLWLGDVGQNAWEEVNIVENGGNYGWRCREGAHDFNTSGCPDGLIDPIIEYSNTSVGDSITGGYVYRGSDIPELVGRYVFADYVRGKIFASVDNGDGTYDFETLRDTSDFISTFAVEPDGELLYFAYSAGRIRRIIRSGGSASNPIEDNLSDTGCVNPADPTEPASGLIPYDVNVPFWSDDAGKERWYAIPDGTSIDVDGDGDWLFPNGTVLVKNFKLNNQLVETRLFMRHTNGEWGGYTYEWNAGQTDATRVVGGKTKNVNGQDWIFPSESECMQCHTSAANYSLGLEHGQLNGDTTYPATGRTANQLITADFIDMLTSPLSDTPANLPKFPDPTDTNESLEDRARSYLHSNCAGCHRSGGPTPSNMDLRFDVALSSTNTCNVDPTSGDLGISNAKLIAPGAPSRSLIIERASRRDSHGMPPLGSNIVDTTGVTLLTNWVNSLGSCP
tara:strand:+ start:1384 stop:7320 length:5937 start_codon:yes stop_codon:yes gene_type:complete